MLLRGCDTIIIAGQMFTNHTNTFHNRLVLFNLLKKLYALLLKNLRNQILNG